LDYVLAWIGVYVVFWQWRRTMTRQTLYALLAVFGAAVVGIILGLVFIAIASIVYSLHYGAC
jgi:tetrahydromethanopterin S-methyltransferase subunit B